MTERIPASYESDDRQDNVVPMQGHEHGNPRAEGVLELDKQFLSRALHPTTLRSSETLARYITDTIGEHRDTPDDHTRALRGLKVNLLDFDDEHTDVWRAQDPVLNKIYDLIVFSRGQAMDNEMGLTAERRALLELLDFRAGEVFRLADELGIDRDANFGRVAERIQGQWSELLDALVPAAAE